MKNMDECVRWLRGKRRVDVGGCAYVMLEVGEGVNGCEWMKKKEWVGEWVMGVRIRTGVLMTGRWCKWMKDRVDE